jgi:hypothetical protein
MVAQARKEALIRGRCAFFAVKSKTRVCPPSLLISVSRDSFWHVGEIHQLVKFLHCINDLGY